MNTIRKEFEDICFKIEQPDICNKLARAVQNITKGDQDCLEILMEGVQQLLKENMVKCAVYGRTKSLYSIYQKMKHKYKPLEKILDRIGLRIIVCSVPDCYRVLGILHAHFRPIPGTFDDYIGLPKDNGYQSLHTSVYPIKDISIKPVEFQIRTKLMHMDAEFGTASHQQYKNDHAENYKNKGQQQCLKSPPYQKDMAESTESFIEILRRQVFRHELVVFGNSGKLISLIPGSTIRDMINFRRCSIDMNDIQVKVNGTIKPLDYSLKDGDTVNIVSEGDHLTKLGMHQDLDQILNCQ